MLPINGSSPSLPPSPISLSSPSSCHSAPLQVPPFAHLHLTPCTFDAYLDLSDEQRRNYQLLDGLLIYDPHMSGPAHSTPQHYTANCINKLNNDWEHENWITAHTEAYIAYIPASRSIASQLSSSNQVGQSCVRADIAVGPYVSARDAVSLSPTSQKVHFPSDKPPPYIVIEITSSNRASDLKIKCKLYALMGIPEYVIVDRKEKHIKVYYMQDVDGARKEPVPRRSARLKEKYGSQTYRSSATFKGEQVVKARFLQDLRLTANQILKPPKAPADVFLSPLRNAEKEIADKDNVIGSLRAENEEKDNVIADKDNVIDDLRAANAAMRRQMMEMQEKINSQNSKYGKTRHSGKEKADGKREYGSSQGTKSGMKKTVGGQRTKSSRSRTGDVKVDVE